MYAFILYIYQQRTFNLFICIFYVTDFYIQQRIWFNWKWCCHWIWRTEEKMTLDDIDLQSNSHLFIYLFVNSIVQAITYSRESNFIGHCLVNNEKYFFYIHHNCLSWQWYQSWVIPHKSVIYERLKITWLKFNISSLMCASWSLMKDCLFIPKYEKDRISHLSLSLFQSLKEGLTVQERMKLFETKDSRKI